MDTDILARCTHGFLVEQRRKLWRPMIHVIKTCAAIRPDETVCVPLSSRADTILMALMLSQLHDHSDFPFRLLFFSDSKPLADELAPLFPDVCSAPPPPAPDVSIALPWTSQDTVEYLLDQLFNAGRIRGVLPRSRAGSGYRVIRPLFDIRREDIASWQQKYFPSLPLGWEKASPEQQEIRQLIARLKTGNPDLEKNIFNSLHNLDLDTMAGQDMCSHVPCSGEESYR